MSNLANSITNQKIAQLRQRRSVLLSARSLCVVASAGIVFLLLAIGVDYLWLLEDQQRWALSLTFYLAAILALGFSLLPWLHRLTPVASARIIEQQLPDLREKVLPAIELQQRPTGSGAFRQQVFDLADRSLQSVSMAAVLPLRLIQHWIWTAGIAALFFIALASFSDSGFLLHMARVLMPAADLGRPSPTKFLSVTPDDSQTHIAPGETVSFEIQIDRPARWQTQPVTLQWQAGDRQQEITLEALESDDNTSVDRLAGRVQQTFVSQLTALQTIKFRFLADRAITPWNEVKVSPRPRVVDYHHQLSFPDYTQLPPKEWAAPHSQLKLVQGTTVQLRVQTDQDMEWANLLWQSDADTQLQPRQIKLDRLTPDQWQHTANLQHSVQYRMKGEAASSGLQAEYTAKQKWAVQPDLPPTVRWIEPRQIQQSTSSQSELQLQFALEDEFPLRSLALQSRLNRGQWKHVSHLTVPQWSWDPEQFRVSSTVTEKLDLMDWELEIGQLLELRLQVTDAKGQQTLSSPASWLISGTPLEWRVPEALRRRLQSLQAVREFRDEINSDEIMTILEGWQSTPAADATKFLGLDQPLTQLAQTAERQTGALRRTLEQHLQKSENPVIAEELQQTLNWLSHWETTFVPTYRQTLTEWQALETDARTTEVNDHLKQQTQLLLQQSDQLARHFQLMVEFDVMSDLSSNLHTARLFALEANQANELGGLTWQRQQALLARHMREVAQKMVNHQQWLLPDHRQALADWARWSGDMADRLDLLAESDTTAPDLEERQQTVLREYQYRRRIMGIVGDPVQTSLQMRQAMRQEPGLAARDLLLLSQRLQPTESSDWDRGDTRTSELQRLARRRYWQYLRHDVDGLFAADLGNAVRAVQALLVPDQLILPEDRATTAAKLQTFQQALAQLEIEHWLTQAEDLLAILKNRERFQAGSHDAESESVRQWENLSYLFAQAQERAAAAGMTQEDQQHLAQLRWSPPAQQSGAAIGPRRWDPDFHVSASPFLEQLRSQLQETHLKLQPTFTAARQLLLQSAPTLADLATRSAQEANRQQQTANTLAKDDPSQTPALAELLQRQYEQQFADQSALRQLQQTLQDRAAAQDVLNETQRDIAKRSDLAKLLVQKTEERLVRKMAEAAQATGAQTKKKLTEWAEEEKRAAQTLEALANFFSQPNPENDAQLIAAAKTMEALGRESDRIEDDYRQAQSLAALQREESEKLLELLEQELQQDSQMQAKLSEISQNIIGQTQATLQQSAREQQEMRDRNESSDQDFQHRKKELQRDLRQMSERAADLAHRVYHRVAEANRRLDSDNGQEQMQAFRDLAHQLSEAAQQARNLNSNQPVEQLQSAAEQLNEAVENLAPKLAELAKEAGERKAEIPHEDSNLWRRSQQENQRWQEQIQQEETRQADSRLQQLNNSLQRDQRELEQAKREVERSEKRVAEAERQLEKNSTADWAKQQLQDQQLRIEQLKYGQQLAQQALEQQEKRVAEEESRGDAIRRQTLPPLSSTHPLAEMTEGLSDRMQQETKQLASDSQELVQDRQWQQQLQTSRKQLEQTAQQEEKIRQAVERSSQDLQRAAQHEARLGKANLGQELQQIAQDINQTQAETLQQTQQSMSAASQADDPVADRKASVQQSQQVQQDLSQAEKQLDQNAQQLADLAQRRSDASPAQQTSNRPQSSPSRSQQDPGDSASTQETQNALSRMSPTEKAQLLDELSGQAAQADSPSAQASAQQQAADQLAQAARQLAQRMNQQRNETSGPMRQSLRQSLTQAQPGDPSQSMQMDGQTGDRPTVAPIVLQPTELDGSWSQLRKKSAEEVVESQRESVSSRYRQQVETYFKLLSRQK